MKKLIALVLALVLCLSVLAGCAAGNAGKTETGKFKITVSIYPLYDWVKNLTHDAENVELSLLVDNGTDMHSYQPTADDMVGIADSDMFVYVGGESDKWVDDAMNGIIQPDKTEVVNLLDALGDRAKTEESVEGMQKEAEEEEEAADEHIWLSLKNAETLCESLSEKLQQADAANAETYKKNTESYTEELKKLDASYMEALSAKKYDTLLFADRFPFRYLVDDYGLKYYAAFAGCSAESEASFETVAFLSDKLRELSLPAIITIDGSDKKIAETVLKTSGCKAEILTLDSMQSATADCGETYLSVMESNLEALKKALL